MRLTEVSRNVCMTPFVSIHFCLLACSASAEQPTNENSAFLFAATPFLPLPISTPLAIEILPTLQQSDP